MSPQPTIPQIVSLFFSLVMTSCMSLLFGRKTSATNWANINYARGLVLGLYICSWTFTTIAAILTSTNTNNLASCTVSIFICVLLYAFSKFFIYLFLIEKVYIVSAVTTRRRHTKLYRNNVLLLSPYVVILVIMILNRVAILSPDGDGQCYIGLKPIASVILIIYDIIVSTWLTFLFIRPLMSTTSALQGPSKGKLRRVAQRTFMGSILAMIFSASNVFTLVYFRGYENSVLCLMSCMLDVTLNACTIHWVTSRQRQGSLIDRKSSRLSSGTGVGSGHTTLNHGSSGGGGSGYKFQSSTSSEKRSISTIPSGAPFDVNGDVAVTINQYEGSPF